MALKCIDLAYKNTYRGVGYIRLTMSYNDLPTLTMQIDTVYPSSASFLMPEALVVRNCARFEAVTPSLAPRQKITG